MYRGPLSCFPGREAYSGLAPGVLALQDEVARNIAEEVRVKLTPQERQRLTTASATDPSAYEAYLKGRFYANGRTGEGIRKSIEYFEQAHREGPDPSTRLCGLGGCLPLSGGLGLPPTQSDGPEGKNSRAPRS